MKNNPCMHMRIRASARALINVLSTLSSMNKSCTRAKVALLLYARAPGQTLFRLTLVLPREIAVS